MPRVPIPPAVAAGDPIAEEWGDDVHEMAANILEGVIEGTIKVGIGPQEYGNLPPPPADGKEYVLFIDFEKPGTNILDKIEWRADIKFPSVSTVAPANPKELDLWGQVIA